MDNLLKNSTQSATKFQKYGTRQKMDIFFYVALRQVKTVRAN